MKNHNNNKPAQARKEKSVCTNKSVFIYNNERIGYKLYSTRPLYPPITFFNILLSVRYNLKQTPNRKYIRWEYKRKDCGIYTFSNIKE